MNTLKKLSLADNSTATVGPAGYDEYLANCNPMFRSADKRYPDKKVMGRILFYLSAENVIRPLKEPELIELCNAYSCQENTAKSVVFLNDSQLYLYCNTLATLLSLHFLENDDPCKFKVTEYDFEQLSNYANDFFTGEIYADKSLGLKDPEAFLAYVKSVTKSGVAESTALTARAKMKSICVLQAIALLNAVKSNDSEKLRTVRNGYSQIALGVAKDSLSPSSFEVLAKGLSLVPTQLNNLPLNTRNITTAEVGRCHCTTPKELKTISLISAPQDGVLLNSPSNFELLCNMIKANPNEKEKCKGCIDYAFLNLEISAREYGKLEELLEKGRE